MPIVNRKNNNKYNIVTNTTPASSAKSHITFDYPWVVNFSANVFPLFTLKDIDQNEVSYVLNSKTITEYPEYLIVDGNVYPYISVGVGDLNLQNNDDINTFVQRFSNIINQKNLFSQSQIYTNNQSLNFDNANTSTSGYVSNLTLKVEHAFVVNNNAPNQGSFIIPAVDGTSYFSIMTPGSLSSQTPTILSNIPIFQLINPNDSNSYTVKSINGFQYNFGIVLEESKEYYFWYDYSLNAWLYSELSFPTTVSSTGQTILLNLTSSTLNSKKLLISHDNQEIGMSSNNHSVFNDFDSSNTLQDFLTNNAIVTIDNNIEQGSDSSVTITNDYIQPEFKSGSLTIDPIVKINNLDKIKFPEKIGFSKEKRENLNITFDDNKSISFIDKTVNLNTNLDVNDNLSSLLVSSPNTHDFNLFTGTKTTQKSFVDYYLKDNQNEIQNTDLFNENTSFYENKQGNFKDEEEIEILVNFSIPAILSNNRTKTPSDDVADFSQMFRYENDQSFAFPVLVENSIEKEIINVKRHSSPTAYFNFSEGRWDYLGNVRRPTYLEASESFPSYEINNPSQNSFEGFEKSIDSIESFTSLGSAKEKIDSFLINNSICFASATNDYSLNIFKQELGFTSGPSSIDIINQYNGSVGVPIGNFGFPFAEKFEPLNDHIIRLKDHIHKDFYLKKVIYDGTFSGFVPGKAVFEFPVVLLENLEPGRIYKITSLGNTDFTQIGSSDPQVGNDFVATGPGTGTGTVKQVDLTGGRRIGINNVSFFLVNNRKNLNETYFDKLEDQQVSSITWDENIVDENGDYTTLKLDNFPLGQENSGLQFSTKDTTGLLRRFSYFKSEDSNTSILDNNNLITRNLIYGAHLLQGEDTSSVSSSQRDLITYSNIVHFCSGSLDQNSEYFCVDYEKTKKDADYFFELEPYHNDSLDVVENDLDNSSSYYKKNIQIESKVKSGTIQKNFAAYSYFPTLLSNNHGRRSLYEYTSGRSNKSEIYSANSENSFTSTIKFNKNMSIAGQQNLIVETNNFNNPHVEDEYILKPSDEICLGVSLTNSLNNRKNQNENLGDDVFIIHNLKVKLIGSYKQKGIKKSLGSIIKNTNYIKRSIVGDNDVFDESSTTPYQLLRNYYTRTYDSHGINSLYSNKDQKINTVSHNFVSLSGKEKIYDSLMNNIFDVLEVDGKKVIDSDWPGMSSYMAGQNLKNYLVVVQPDFQSPTEYDNEKWTYSYPFEEKYSNLNRPLNINYERLNLKGIADTLETSPGLGDVNKVFPSNPLFQSIGKNANNYFYSFNRKNPNRTRMPVASITSIGDQPPEAWFNEEWSFSIDGFKLGVLNPNLSYNRVAFNSKKYGNFSDKINSNTNYVKINSDGDLNYTVIKNFYKDFVPTTDIALIENTYNKDKYSKITKPFIDKDINELTELNSIP
jgi:hypothetical protein